MYIIYVIPKIGGEVIVRATRVSTEQPATNKRPRLLLCVIVRQRDRQRHRV